MLAMVGHNEARSFTTAACVQQSIEKYLYLTQVQDLQLYVSNMQNCSKHAAHERHWRKWKSCLNHNMTNPGIQMAM